MTEIYAGPARRRRSASSALPAPRTLTGVFPGLPRPQGVLVLPLDRTVADIVALSAAGVALLSLLVAIVAVARVGRLRRALAAPDGRSGSGPVALGADESRALREQLAVAERRIGALSDEVAGALRHVAVVRYDAFQDMGGRMSFSAALLDDAGDGIVLTAINGRSETRAYAKGLRGGVSEQALSPEEQQAIEHALRASGIAKVPARRAG
jgi:hypothetical protein